LATNDQNRDELDKLFGQPLSDTAAREPGEFTRTFFGQGRDLQQAGSSPVITPNQDSTQKLVESDQHAPGELPAAPPGQFTRLFGSLNRDAPPKDLPSGDQGWAYGDQHNERGQFGPGSLTEPPAPFSQPAKPPGVLPDTFTRVFNFQGLEGEPVPPVPPRQEVGDVFGTVSPSVVLPTPDQAQLQGHLPLPPSRVEPFQEQPRAEVQGADAELGGLQRQDPQEATRLFRLEKPTTGLQPPLGGPSAFTRVINSSALRSAEQNEPAYPGAADTPAQAATPPQLSPAPVWPIAAFPPPQAPPAYIAPQPAPMPVQMSPPPMPSLAWPQPPSFPAAAVPSVPQPQVPPLQQTSEQKWITYLPLIIALNVLFFVAVLLILLFALWR